MLAKVSGRWIAVTACRYRRPGTRIELCPRRACWRMANVSVLARPDWRRDGWKAK